MPVYPDFSPPPQRNRFIRILTISILVGSVLLLGIGGMFGLIQSRFLLGPTPTPTATYAPPLTSTPDFRATHVMEDMLTQATYSAIQHGTPPPPGPSEII